MAKRCNCHKDVRAAMDGGMEFYEAMRQFGKWGDHEHRCECGCGCKRDTFGYAYCPSCHFDEKCWATRGQTGVGFLGMPVYKDDRTWDMPVEDVVLGTEEDRS